MLQVYPRTRFFIIPSNPAACGGVYSTARSFASGSEHSQLAHVLWHQSNACPELRVIPSRAKHDRVRGARPGQVSKRKELLWQEHTSPIYDSPHRQPGKKD